jgi:hypothetical protein
MKIRILIYFLIFFIIIGCSSYEYSNNYFKRIEYTLDWENIKFLSIENEDFCFATDSTPVNVRFNEKKLSDRCFTSHEVKFIQEQVILNNSDFKIQTTFFEISTERGNIYPFRGIVNKNEFKFSPPYSLARDYENKSNNICPCCGLFRYHFNIEFIYYRCFFVKSNHFTSYDTPVIKLPDTIVVWQKYTPEDSLCTREYLKNELLLIYDSTSASKQLDVFLKVLK